MEIDPGVRNLEFGCLMIAAVQIEGIVDRVMHHEITRSDVGERSEKPFFAWIYENSSSDLVSEVVGSELHSAYGNVLCLYPCLA